MTRTSEGVTRAHTAAASGRWDEAYATLRALDLETLEGIDLETLADAAWWMCEPRESIDFRQRAYGAYAAEGREEDAGATAARLAVDHFGRGMMSVGSGWLASAHRHLDDRPPSRAHAMLWTIEATVRRHMGDVDGSLELARRAAALARDLRDRGGHAIAIHTEGMALVTSGHVSEGLALLDEAMTSVVAGELDPFMTGVVYCNVIGMCLEVADLRRAGEWSAAAMDWCASLSVDAPFTSLCRINRAHVARLSGSWELAEAEARRAADDLVRFDDAEAVSAFGELGEIRRRRGDLGGAAEAFDRARALGHEPQPGAALLALALGRPDDAAAGLRRALEQAGPPIERARLLAAAVDVALASGEIDRAAALTDELRGLAAATAAPALQAASDHASGAVLVARDDASAALEPLRRACATWLELRLPYEHARTRVTLGDALQATGDEDGARHELDAAREAFARLGAPFEPVDGRQQLPDRMTQREAEVLRLVASGMTNRDIAVELVLSEHTIGRHIQNIYAKIGVTSRAAATAYAFEHGLM